MCPFLVFWVFMDMNIQEIFRRNLLIFENFDQSTMNEILKGYLTAALWTEEENISNDYKSSMGYNDDTDVETLPELDTTFTIDEIEPDSKIQAYLDIKKFIELAGLDAVQEAIQENGEEKFGIDIWLTRNHHGAGFFDHSYEHEQQLINAAHALKEVELYVTNSNTLAFSNQ